MPGSPNKLSQFWQELKRRKVVRVITVYAAATFAIIDLLSNIDEPLGLPEWTLPFAIVFLCIGFIIAVILSWIYDIHPEGGVVKTEPVDKVKEEEIPKSSNRWKIASYISIVVIIFLVILNILPRTGKKEILEKSIAVLPFDNMSISEEYSHIGDAFTDEIILELQKIKEFERVLSRSSTMQYKDDRPTIPEMAEKLGVNYIIEGSIQRHNEEVSIRVQVIRAQNEDHIWANEYNGKWKDIFSIQDEIAFQVANELQIALSPEEKTNIEKTPTTSPTAYDFYLRAKGTTWGNITLLTSVDDKAIEDGNIFYRKALEYDPTFALAYTGLAMNYWAKYERTEYLTEGFLDSVLILTNSALTYDNELSEAYVIKGDYYRAKNNPEQAIINYDKAIQLNPNDWMPLWNKGWLYINVDIVQCLSNYHKAINLYKGPSLSSLLYHFGGLYRSGGFNELATKYAQQAFELDGDSVGYFSFIAGSYTVEGKYEKSIEFYEKAYDLDSGNFEFNNQLGMLNSFIGNYKESLKYFEDYLALGGLSTSGLHRIGFAYWHNGYTEKAKEYLNMQIEYSQGEIELGRQQAGTLFPYYDIAGVYAFLEEKDKAFENLRIFNQKEKISFWFMHFINNDPLFDSIRNEPEFQQILRDVEAKYQAEHERVRKWLEENDML